MTTVRLPRETALADPFFHTCLAACLRNREFVESFDRLTGSCLSIHKLQPIEQMIDRATGRTDESVARFVDFVHEVIYMRVPDSTGVEA